MYWMNEHMMSLQRVDGDLWCTYVDIADRSDILNEHIR